MAGKSQNDLMLDAAFDYIRAAVTSMTICTTQPTTYSQALSVNALAVVTMASTDITTTPGDTSGRKMHIGSETGITVDTTGVANHIALVDTDGTALLFVTTCTTQQLTTGNTVNIPAWDDEILDVA
jgi:hypothetical protein